MLAPARPSPTRAGVKSRRSVSERDAGAGVFISLLGWDGCLAQPHRIIRCILLTDRTRACEHDQGTSDQPHRNHTLDLAPSHARPRILPAHLSSLAEPTALPAFLAEHDQCTLHIRP